MQAPEQGVREWLIDDSARQLFRSMMKPSQPPVSRAAQPAAKTKTIEPSRAGSGESLGRVPPTQGENENKVPPLRSKPAFWIVCLLIFGGLAYGARLGFSPPPSKPCGPGPATGRETSTQSPAHEMSLESQGTLSLSPTLSVIQCEPGASASQVLVLANNTRTELTFEVAALDVIVRDGRTVFLQAGATPNSIAATVLSQKYLNVKPHVEASIAVTFAVHPQTTSRGVLILLKGTDKATFGGNTYVTPPPGVSGRGCRSRDLRFIDIQD